MASLSLCARVLVLVLSALLLGVLIVTARDGITVGGGVFGLVCFGLLALTVLVIAYYKAQKSSEEEDGERAPPALVILLLVIVFILLAFGALGKFYEEGHSLAELFPLTKFSFLTVFGPMLIFVFVLVGVVGTFIQNHGPSWKAKLSALRERMSGEDD
jgi:hypothetical protein